MKDSNYIKQDRLHAQETIVTGMVAASIFQGARTNVWIAIYAISEPKIITSEHIQINIFVDIGYFGFGFRFDRGYYRFLIIHDRE